MIGGLTMSCRSSDSLSILLCYCRCCCCLLCTLFTEKLERRSFDLGIALIVGLLWERAEDLAGLQDNNN